MLIQRGQDLDESAVRRSIDMVLRRRAAEQRAHRRHHARRQGQAGATEDGRPEALHRRDPRERHHVRARPGRHRQELAGRGDGRAGAAAQAGAADHPHPSGGRGRRAARLPARRPDGQDRPVPAPAVRRAVRHGRAGGRPEAARAAGGRGRPAGVHPRPHAEHQLHHPRRGAERHARADEDVPDPHRLRLEGRRHRRHHPGRRARRAQRPARPRAHARPASTGSPSSTSARATSCATGSSPTSSPPTSAPTPSSGRTAPPS